VLHKRDNCIANWPSIHSLLSLPGQGRQRNEPSWTSNCPSLGIHPQTAQPVLPLSFAALQIVQIRTDIEDTSMTLVWAEEEKKKKFLGRSKRLNRSTGCAPCPAAILFLSFSLFFLLSFTLTSILSLSFTHSFTHSLSFILTSHSVPDRVDIHNSLSHDNYHTFIFHISYPYTQYNPLQHTLDVYIPYTQHTLRHSTESKLRSYFNTHIHTHTHTYTLQPHHDIHAFGPTNTPPLTTCEPLGRVIVPCQRVHGQHHESHESNEQQRHRRQPQPEQRATQQALPGPLTLVAPRPPHRRDHAARAGRVDHPSTVPHLPHRSVGLLGRRGHGPGCLDHLCLGR
jgi:hypothetical protein